MKLRLIRVYTNTFDLDDPKRVVTTNPRRSAQHWWTVRVRAVSSSKAWSYVKRMVRAPDAHHAGMVEAQRVGLDNKLEKRCAPYKLKTHGKPEKEETHDE